MLSLALLASLSLLMTPAVISAPTSLTQTYGWTENGCLLDSWDRALSAYQFAVDSMTTLKCQQACQSRNYLYAGLEAGTQCFCANSITYSDWSSGASAPSSDCNIPCAGNKTENCGGAFRLWTYKYGVVVEGSSTETVDVKVPVTASTAFSSSVSSTATKISSTTPSSSIKTSGVSSSSSLTKSSSTVIPVSSSTSIKSTSSSSTTLAKSITLSISSSKVSPNAAVATSKPSSSVSTVPTPNTSTQSSSSTQQNALTKSSSSSSSSSSSGIKPSASTPSTSINKTSPLSSSTPKSSSTSSVKPSITSPPKNFTITSTLESPSTTSTSSPLSASTTTTSTASKNGKAGLGWTSSSGSNFTSFTSLPHNKLSWTYDWNSVIVPGTPLDSLEFVPMAWGAGSVEGFKKDSASFEGLGVRELLSFNEPDQSFDVGGSQITPSQAAITHQRIFNETLSAKYRIGAPAVARGSKWWLEQWIAACDGNCTYDFIPLHFYGIDAGDMITYIKDFIATFGKPVWVTEYACMDFGGPTIVCNLDQAKAFQTQIIKYMEFEPMVERYAAFGTFTDWASGGNANGMMNADGSANELGALYATT